MKKKYNIKRYIPVVIAAIIFVCAYFLSSSIYEASFEQYIYSLLKSTGNSVSGFSYVFNYKSGLEVWRFTDKWKKN